MEKRNKVIPLGSKLKMNSFAVLWLEGLFVIPRKLWIDLDRDGPSSIKE